MRYESSAQRTLRKHEYVYDVRDVSIGEKTTLTVQFNTIALPKQILENDRYTVREVWVGVYPSWYLRWFASKFAMRHGLGSSAIAAEIEVVEE